MTHRPAARAAGRRASGALRHLCLSGLAALWAVAAPPPAVGKDAAAVARGGAVYGSHCVTCHGANADGEGRTAHLYKPRPANLRASDKNDAYLTLIIRKGGAALGRSEVMPAWESELDESQIRDLVSYLRSINNRPAQ